MVPHHNSLYYWQLLAARRKLPMDEFNEMLKCSKLKTRAIFYVFYLPGISLDVHPMGLTNFSVLTRIIFKVNPIIELPFFISSAIPTTWVITISQFYWWDNVICSLYQRSYCDRELDRLRDTLPPHYLPHRLNVCYEVGVYSVQPRMSPDSSSVFSPQCIYYTD